MADVQSSRRLAILLGASKFPRSPQLLGGSSFSNSAADFKTYLTEERGLGLADQNLLPLFDDERPASEQLLAIANFLETRNQQLEDAGSDPLDLLIYYVGHGFFTSGTDQSYCLAVSSTSRMVEGHTSIRAVDLAAVVKRYAMRMRRYLIIDCCFAGSLFKEFQSDALTPVRVQLKKEFPVHGTALLCAASSDKAARAPEGLTRTMFSDALIRSLRSGHLSVGPRLCFSELGELVQEYLRTTFGDEYVRPEVHSPDQREGDVAHIPLFPNPAFRKPRPVKPPPPPSPTDRRITEASRDKEIAIRVAEELKRAQISEKSRLAAQEAAADRILNRQKRKRAQDAEKKRFAAEMAAQARAVRIAAEAETEKRRLKAERAAEARALRIAEEAEAEKKRLKAARPAPAPAIQFTKRAQALDFSSDKKGTEPAIIETPGEMIGLVSLMVPLGNILGLYMGRYWAQLDCLPVFRLHNGIWGEAALEFALGVIVGRLFRGLAAFLAPDKKLRRCAFVIWPGFLAGAAYYNHLPPESQPSIWLVLGAIAVFLGAAY